MNPVVDEGKVPPPSIKAEVEELRAQLRREHEMYIRALADFESYRRRIEREREKSVQAGKRELILALLEVMDEIDRSVPLSQISADEALQRLASVQTQLARILSAQGVTPFESQGQPFDPMYHEVIEMTGSIQSFSGQVVAELQRGYCWNKEVLRPARVKLVP